MSGRFLKYSNAKYTTSRMTRCTTTPAGKKKKLGTGWSHDGLYKYNDFYLAIQNDRVQIGHVFNEVFLRHYHESKESRKVTNGRKAGDSKRQDAPQTYNEVYRIQVESEDASNWQKTVTSV
jgi:hypothetical protein